MKSHEILDKTIKSYIKMFEAAGLLALPLSSSGTGLMQNWAEFNYTNLSEKETVAQVFSLWIFWNF